MTTGKHIGKVVIKIREEEQIKSALHEYNPTVRMNATRKTFLNPTKVYIITGGLGGFGLELTYWMVFNGAKKVVLTSRSGIKTNYQKAILKRFEEFGANFEALKTEICISTHDTNTIEGAKQLLEYANKLGPIGGIFHLAVVLNDALFDNQTIETFCETCDSKINAFVNLDKLTRDSSQKLDFFVGFSSVSCGRGNAGQTNYGFANSVIERICESRRRDGLHGLVIQWGPIDDVGVMADTQMTAIHSFLKQRINSCLEVLDAYLQYPNAVLSSMVSVFLLNIIQLYQRCPRYEAPGGCVLLEILKFRGWVILIFFENFFRNGIIKKISRQKL
jgi:fatty acid synthase